MNEFSMLIVALGAGGVLGLGFYGGLWWTVGRTIGRRTGTLWLPASFVLRTGITVTGFLIVGRGDWRALLACLAGFVVARIGVTRLTRDHPQRKEACTQGGSR